MKSRKAVPADDAGIVVKPIEGAGRICGWIASYVKVRAQGRIVSVAVIVAVGIDGDGRREVLGMDIGPALKSRTKVRSSATSSS